MFIVLLFNLLYGNQVNKMKDASVKVIEILAKDSESLKYAENKFKLYYQENIPNEIKDVLTLVLPVAKIINDREIILYKKEF